MRDDSIDVVVVVVAREDAAVAVAIAIAIASVRECGRWRRRARRWSDRWWVPPLDRGPFVDRSIAGVIDIDIDIDIDHDIDVDR